VEAALFRDVGGDDALSDWLMTLGCYQHAPLLQQAGVLTIVDASALSKVRWSDGEEGERAASLACRCDISGVVWCAVVC
jgi:hypothetical protein